MPGRGPGEAGDEGEGRLDFGIFLRQTRLRRGFTLAESALAVRVPEQYLEALELEDYDALPPKPYVKGFLDALRRMLANLLAFQILSNIPGIGGFLSQRAAGGPVSAGQPVLVGERGPELFIPGASGSIRNNSAMNADSIGGGSTFITNIDARGADPGLIARLPTIMEQRDKKLMLKMKRFIETGSVTI